MDRLSVLEALADDSRYAIFTELGRSDQPLSTMELAQRLDLHPNTVRLHLERLRAAGLVRASAVGQGTVGRPQHHWATTAGAPAVGLQPDGSRVLAQLLAEALAALGPEHDTLSATGRRAGAGRLPAPAPAPAARRRRAQRAPQEACLAEVLDELGDLGFDPVAEEAGGPSFEVAFTSCPFRELAAAYPDLVCTLHRGMTEGIVAAVSARTPGVRAAVTAFSTLVDADPCRAELSLAAD
ncbi:MAG: helix-turn-helix transcriptional regulator [Acidimicrobiales bacterium]